MNATYRQGQTNKHQVREIDKIYWNGKLESALFFLRTYMGKLLLWKATVIVCSSHPRKQLQIPQTAYDKIENSILSPSSMTHDYSLKA